MVSRQLVTANNNLIPEYNNHFDLAKPHGDIAIVFSRTHYTWKKKRGNRKYVYKKCSPLWLHEAGDGDLCSRPATDMLSIGTPRAARWHKNKPCRLSIDEKWPTTAQRRENKMVCYGPTVHYLTGTLTRRTVKRRDGKEIWAKSLMARTTHTSCVVQHNV